MFSTTLRLPLQPKTVARLGVLHLCAGFGLAALSAWGLWRDIGWIAQPFYAYAWWSYIFILDGLSALRRGDSLLTTRRRYVLSMCLWSTTFWCFFELLNVRFQNWYYVGVFTADSLLELLGGGVFVVLSFSTVFVGIFSTYDALTAFGLWRRRDAPAETPGKLPTWVSYAVQGLGAAMAFTAIVFPYYCAPLIWGSFTFIVDPWNYRRGTRSILRDMESRDWGLFGRVFVAGLICGVVWESCNYLAPQKWIYTVRGLENFKLFEMPLLGFLGFPALAFDCLAAYALMASFLGRGETWERLDDLSYAMEPQKHTTPRAQSLSRAQPLFWALVALLAVDTNCGSFELTLQDLDLSAVEERQLRGLDVQRPRQLLRRVEASNERTQLASDLAWVNGRLNEIVGRAELYTFKGIGARYGHLLERLGVHRVDDLALRDETELHRRLTAVANEQEERPPRLDWVRVWVLAAKSPGVVLRVD